MKSIRTQRLCLFIVITSSWLGCQKGPAPAPAQPAASPSQAASTPPLPAEPTSAPQRVIPTISLSGDSGTAEGTSAPGGGSLQVSASAITPVDTDTRRNEIVSELKSLQIMLGDWHGTTQKEFGDFKAIDHPHWVWDFLSDKSQPALVMTSGESPYFRAARLTWLPEEQKYRLSTEDAEGLKRTFEGAFSVPVEEFQGDDRKLHKRYKLELTQTDAPSPKEAWQVVFNQQDNNRYLVELAKKRGSGFLRFDTIATQREGTSFAKSDTDYGDKECIISAGLGTIQVSYQGKSYWVCCTGCKAAFEEDPAKWIAEAAAKKAKE